MSEDKASELLEEAERRLHAGDYAAAEQASRQVLEAAPDSAVARSKLGVALAQQGRLDEAIAEFSKALQLHPTYASAYSNLGNAYYAEVVGRMVRSRDRGVIALRTVMAARRSRGTSLTSCSVMMPSRRSPHTTGNPPCLNGRK